MKNRLSKIMALSGIASRRACEEIIFARRVRVNGKVVDVPQTQVDPSLDRITVDGESLPKIEKKQYFLLNKPLGYICTNAKTHNQKIVQDLFPHVKERLFTVGRLDKETSGLLIVTNDGHFANNVIHPSNNITKEYVAKTDKEITDKHLKIISKGVVIEGVHVTPVSVAKVRKGTVKVIVAEGKTHEVRLLIANAGLTVRELKRTRIGSLHLGKLPLGGWRHLTEGERESLAAS